MFAFKYISKPQIISWWQSSSKQWWVEFASHINSFSYFSLFCSLRFLQNAELGVFFLQNIHDNTVCCITFFSIWMICWYIAWHTKKYQRPLQSVFKGSFREMFWNWRGLYRLPLGWAQITPTSNPTHQWNIIIIIIIIKKYKECINWIHQYCNDHPHKKLKSSLSRYSHHNTR